MVVAEREERHRWCIPARRDGESENLCVELLRTLTIANLEHDVPKLVDPHVPPSMKQTKQSYPP